MIFSAQPSRHTHGFKQQRSKSSLMASPNNASMAESKTPVEERFLKWLLDHGAHFPKIAWPVTTSNGLRGAMAREPIATNEVMLSIPARLMISEATCWADPVLRRVYAENCDVFCRDDPVLALFLVREMAKDAASFYYPYLSILPEVRSVQDWTPAELSELRDPLLVDAAARRVAEMKAFYSKIMRRLGEKYPGEFPADEYTFTRFRFAWKTIQARTFGRRLPWTALVPFADCLNHSNVATKYDYDVDSNGVFQLYPSGTNSYAQGCEVFNSYGRRPNFQLLLDYGFALEDNEWDYVEVPLPRDIAQAIGTRFPFRKRLRLEKTTTLEALFPLQQFPIDPTETATPGELKSRHEVLEWFRALVANTLSGFDTTLEDDTARLRMGGLDEAMCLALVYRIGRMHILSKLLLAVDRELADPTQAPERKSEGHVVNNAPSIARVTFV